MSSDTLEYRHYRCKTKTAIGSKDWAIAVTPDGHLAVRFCATGGTARLRDIPPSSFEAASAKEEMALRESKQIAQGYSFIGRAVVQKGRLEPVAPSAISRGTTWLHWEIKAPIGRDVLLAELSSSVLKLQAGPLPDPIELDVSLGVCVVKSPIPWEFGYSDAGGIFPDDRGGGAIQSEQGVLPVLLLIALQRRFPDQLRLADANGDRLSTTFSGEDPILGEHRFDRRLIVDLVGRLGWCSSWMPLPEITEVRAALWV